MILIKGKKGFLKGTVECYIPPLRKKHVRSGSFSLIIATKKSFVLIKAYKVQSINLVSELENRGF